MRHGHRHRPLLALQEAGTASGQLPAEFKGKKARQILELARACTSIIMLCRESEKVLLRRP